MFIKRFFDNFFTVTSSSGVRIYSELYAWVAVFMLPINSALNPVLYTLTTQLFKQQLARIVYTWRAGGVPVECQHESSGISMTSAPYNGRWSKNSASLSTSDVSSTEVNLVDAQTVLTIGYTLTCTHKFE
ncbi:uncharacterized protein CDAR_175381 [Caerostris darwini]|uniref:G-protein coupled receptors family 1 profile domain-containing protein n=1 Tax=Caerostris darwini TaxID=1538125 RepID=A0AAV4VYS4_9ARAC|nr:uncharacterized protein CDAR_175381 [Caerostris darwini]